MAYSEAERLQDLRATGLLDTAPDERYDAITTMAARLFDVPIALVSFVDQSRLFFKSRHGIGATEAPRELSLCQQSIHEQDVLVVPDAQADSRFRDGGLVAGAPHIRFYAGHPIHGPAGARIGTLCVMAPEPRSMDEQDLIHLRTLAKFVDNLIREEAGEAVGNDGLLKGMVDSIDTEVALLDRRGKITFVNEAWRKFSDENDGPSGHFEGTDYMGAFAGTTDRESRTVAKRIQEVLDGDRDEMEHEYPCPGPGGMRWFLMRVQRVDWDGPFRVVVLHDNITDRKEAEAARAAKTKARVENQEKSKAAQFSRRVLDTLAHELHTPLTPMRLRLHTLGMADLPEPAQRSVESLNESLKRLEELSARILDVVRLLSRDTPVRPMASSTVGLRRLVEASARNLGLSHRVVLSDIEDHEVALDEQWIPRVLDQFLGNAARFSPGETPITVRIHRARHRIRVEVQDQGIGLDRVEAEHLFRLFGQAHDPHEDARVGPALGLFIAAKIIDAHRGKIGLDSAGPNQGCTAWFELPVVNKEQAVAVAEQT